MIKSTLIGFYGGTFDPVHYGHLKTVTALANLVGLKQVILIPNNIPPHRNKPTASPKQRLDMAQLAIAEMPANLFAIDQRELYRNAPSYTWETLRSLRQEHNYSDPLAFIIGQDSLLTLPGWYRGLELLDLCHLLVCARPGYSVDTKMTKHHSWMLSRSTDNPDDLSRTPAGFIYYCSYTPKITISASEIRKRYQIGLNCDKLMPKTIQSYINKHGLYR